MSIEAPMTKQPKIALLSNEYSVCWGWGGKWEARFAPGTLCRIATNLPAKDGKLRYWIRGKPVAICLDGQNAPQSDFDSWHDTYGFLVDTEAVTGRATIKRKRA